MSTYKERTHGSKNRAEYAVPQATPKWCVCCPPSRRNGRQSSVRPQRPSVRGIGWYVSARQRGVLSTSGRGSCRGLRVMYKSLPRANFGRRTLCVPSVHKIIFAGNTHLIARLGPQLDGHTRELLPITEQTQMFLSANLFGLHTKVETPVLERVPGNSCPHLAVETKKKKSGTILHSGYTAFNFIVILLGRCGTTRHEDANGGDDWKSSFHDCMALIDANVRRNF